MRWDLLRSAMLGLVVCFPISLALIAMPLATPANADVVAPADMLQLNNQLRFAIGSPTVPADPRLTQAAINHANYSSANGQGGHYETAGLPYYTRYPPVFQVRWAIRSWSCTPRDRTCRCALPRSSHRTGQGSRSTTRRSSSSTTTR